MTESIVSNDKFQSGEKILFWLLIIVYFLTHTRFSIPYKSSLRWIVLIIFFMYWVLFKNKFSISTFSIKRSGIIWFAIIFIPNILSVLNAPYALFRTFSLFITLISLSVCFNQGIYYSGDDQFGLIRLKKYFSWLSILLISASVLNLLSQANGYYGGRFRGFFSNANGCAVFCVFALICAAYQIYNSDHKMLFRILCLLIYIEIVLTQSRMGFAVATIIFVLLPLLVSDNVSVQEIFINLGLMAVLIFAGYQILKFVDAGVIDRLLEYENSRSSWEYAQQRISQNPLFGVGYSITAYNQQLYPNDDSWRFFSSYYEFAVDCGIVGLVVVLVFFAKRLIEGIRMILVDKFVLFLFVFVLAGLTIGISESYLLAVGNPLSIFFWIAFMIFDAYVQEVKRYEP